MNDCVICLEPIQGNAARCPGICSGKFHNACLQRWVERKPTCPMCRTPFNATTTSSAGRIVGSTPLSSLQFARSAVHIEGQDAMIRLGPPPLACGECGCTRIVNANGCDQVCTGCGLVVRSVYYST